MSKLRLDNDDVFEGYQSVMRALDATVAQTEWRVRNPDMRAARDRNTGELAAWTKARDALLTVVTREQEKRQAPQ